MVIVENVKNVKHLEISKWGDGISRLFFYLSIVTVVVFLTVGSIQDIRKKKISIWILLLLIPAFVLQLLSGVIVSLKQRVIGILVGAIFFLISKVTREQIGKGDAYVITALGFILGGFGVFEMLCYSFILTMVAAMILLFIFHTQRKKTIPFLPFLLLGYICMLVFGGVKL